RYVRQREISAVSNRCSEVSNYLAIAVHRFARTHLLFHVEPVCKPVVNLVIVQRFARCSLQNFANNLLSLLLRERTIFRITFGPLDPETDFPRLPSLITDSFRRSVPSLFPFERPDSDFGRPLEPLASRASVAAYPVRRTCTGVLS